MSGKTFETEYAKIANEAGVSSDCTADVVLEELTEGIVYTTSCAIREDLINLLDDNEEAIEVVKDYFKDLPIVDD